MLVISDLHFTDKPTDKYRFEIFSWVLKYFKRTDDKNLLILGDLTDSKDHHSAALVNSIIEHLMLLTSQGMEIFILKGNHDYIDPSTPFFKFLNWMEYVTFITEPCAKLLDGMECLFLPHTRKPLADWAAFGPVEKYKDSADFVFMHESVIGSVTSNGYEMEKGLKPSYFRRFKGEVISGDIHCPQTIGPVTYVGTPYSIRFNDAYRGRALRIQTADSVEELFPDIKTRCTFDVSSVQEFNDKALEEGTGPGDQVKIRYLLDELDDDDWGTTRRQLYVACENIGADLQILQVVRPDPLPLRGKKHKAKWDTVVAAPADVVDRFATRHALGKAKHRTGRRIVEE